MRVLCFFFCLSSLRSGAQYLIRHDFQKQNTAYFRVCGDDTVLVKKPNIKRDSRVLLQVENFNPFYYNAKVITVTQPGGDQGAAAIYNPFSVLVSSLGASFSSIPALNLPSETARGYGGTAADQYMAQLGRFKEVYNHFRKEVDLKNELTFLAMELTDLKYDISRSETEIKMAAQDAVRTTLHTARLDLNDAVRKGAQLQDDLQATLDSALEIGASLASNDGALPAAGGSITGERMVREVQTGIKQLRNTQDQLDDRQSLYTNQLVTIAQLYKEIMNTQYRYQYALDNSSGASVLKLKVFSRNDSIASDTVVRYFPIARRNALSLRNSVGLAFTFFGQSNPTYFIAEDSSIGRENGNVFVPVLCTFIHFFPASASAVKWGGAFGFGIPVTNEANKNVNFMLGLNLVFGSNEPIFLTIGACGAKVNKLTGGAAVGGKTSEKDVTKLVRNYYGIGGFLSISFNLSNLGLKH